MARVKNPIVVLGPDGRPLAGASVLTRVRATSADAPVYSSESGGSTISSTQTSDAQGNVPGWLNRGAYESVVSHVSMSSYTVAWDAAPAGDHTIDEPWMADDSVAARAVVDALRPSQGATAGTEALRALGTGAGQALPGNDASVTGPRTPTAHAASHKMGASDPIAAHGIQSGTTDGTGLFSFTVAHGLGATPTGALCAAAGAIHAFAPCVVSVDGTNVTVTGNTGAGFAAWSCRWSAFR